MCTFGQVTLPKLKYVQFVDVDPHFVFKSVAWHGVTFYHITFQQTFNMMNQVSSRGCSRAFILCVLFRSLQYVRNLRTASQSVSFPFQVEAVEDWLVQAHEDCSSTDFQQEYGGTEYNSADPSTFWTSASHFFTWWKNNIERKSKFQSLLRDSDYAGSDEKCIKRSMYCKQAIALAINIKNHFDRVVNQQVDRTIIVQILLPFQMPPHLENLREVCTECNICSPSSTSAQNYGSKTESFFAECARCIRNTGFEEFLTALLNSTSAKTVGKKRSGSGSAFRKRIAASEDDDNVFAGKSKRHREQLGTTGYSPMDCMHQAVGLQNARRVLRSSKEAALEDMSSSSFDFDDAGSALLLELKEIVKVDQDGSGSRFDADAKAVEGRPGDRVQILAPPTNSEYPPVHDSLHIITSPFAYEKRSSPEHRLSMDTPTGTGTGGPMQDLLFSCYRDGIYPSPVVPFHSSASLLGSIFQSHHSPLQSKDGREGNVDTATGCAGTEMDTGEEQGFAHNPLPPREELSEAKAIKHIGPIQTAGNLQGESSSGGQHFREADAQLRAHRGCTSPQQIAYPDSSSPLRLSAGSAITVPPSAEHESGGLPLVLAYDELQQLLTHLLAEPRD